MENFATPSLLLICQPSQVVQVSEVSTIAISLSLSLRLPLTPFFTRNSTCYNQLNLQSISSSQLPSSLPSTLPYFGTGCTSNRIHQQTLTMSFDRVTGTQQTHTHTHKHEQSHTHTPNDVDWEALYMQIMIGIVCRSCRSPKSALSLAMRLASAAIGDDSDDSSDDDDDVVLRLGLAQHSLMNLLKYF